VESPTKIEVDVGYPSWSFEMRLLSLVRKVPARPCAESSFRSGTNRARRPFPVNLWFPGIMEPWRSECGLSSASDSADLPIIEGLQLRLPVSLI